MKCTDPDSQFNSNKNKKITQTLGVPPDQVANIKIKTQKSYTCESIEVQDEKQLARKLLTGYGTAFSFDDIFTTCSIEGIALTLIDDVFANKELKKNFDINQMSFTAPEFRNIFPKNSWFLLLQFFQAFLRQKEEFAKIAASKDKENEIYEILRSK